MQPRGDDILDQAALLKLTGYSQAGKQIDWLAENGVRHKVVGRRAIVLWSHVAMWIEGGQMPPPKPAGGAPNWGAVN